MLVKLVTHDITKLLTKYLYPYSPSLAFYYTWALLRLLLGKWWEKIENDLKFMNKLKFKSSFIFRHEWVLN